MGQSTPNFTTDNGYIVFYITCTQNSQSIPNNTSTVTVNMYCKRTNTGYTTYGTGTSYLTINGTQYTAAITTGMTITSTARLMISKVVTIPHNPDGTKTLAMSADIAHSQFAGVLGNYSQVLTTIPRASTIVASNFAVGATSATIPVVITEFSTAFTYNHSVYCNGVLVKSATGLDKFTSIVLTDAENNTLIGAMGTSNSSTVTINIATMSGGVQAGSTQTDTCTVTSAASTIAVTAFTVGSTLPITVTRVNDLFTHDLEFKMGATSIKTITGIATAGTMTFTATEIDNIYKAMTTASTATGTVLCTQKNGATIKGSVISANVTVTVGAGILPTIASITAGTVNAVTGTYIKNVTPITLTMNTVALGGFSPIASYKINFNGVDYAAASQVVGVVNTSGPAVVATATVTDSRNRTSSPSDTVSLNILDYSNPTISAFTVQRYTGALLDVMGTQAKIICNASVKDMTNGVQKNQLTYVIKSKLKTEPTLWTTIAGPTTLALGTLALAYNVTTAAGTYLAVNSYDFKVEITDKITPTAPVVSQLALSSGQVTMSWGKTGIGIGKIWEVGDGALGVEGTVKVNGAVTATSFLGPITGHASSDLALTGGAISGTVTAPKAALNTNTTQLATTSFVVGQASTTTPVNSSTAAIGTSLTYARSDHNHGDDTSKANLASPTFTGAVTTPAITVNGGVTAVSAAFSNNLIALNVTGSTSVGTPRLQLTNVNLTSPGNPLSINTSFGSSTIGMENTDYCHMRTAGLAGFYFEDSIKCAGQISPYANNAVYSGLDSFCWKGVYTYALTNKSDRKEKRNIVKLDNSYAYDLIKNMNTYQYNYVNDDRIMAGMMADEMPMEIIDNEGWAGVDLYALITMTTSALKETMVKVETLETKVDTLEDTVQMLINRLELLEAK